MRLFTFKFSPLKKIIGLLILAEMLSLSAMANPGDTTTITVWNLRKLTQYGNYDTVANFPTGKRYRKIRMHYILGRYACPSGSQYCGSWDYTTQIFARPANLDSVEIARIITPYATDWLSLNKKHDYVVEVTDYAKALEGLTAMRFNYSGYSWGFTITLKIEFIEGIPPMDVIAVKNIYGGYFPWGNSGNSIENYLTSKTYSYGTSAAKVVLKNTVSGHGSDNAGCAEFCAKTYDLKINNVSAAQYTLWRNTCGINQVYPQTGTWIYNRGNWCPGAVVWPVYHDLSTLTTANSNFSVNIDMPAYIGSGSLGGYNFETQLITYSVANFSRDVSIEDIMAPTKDANYFRHNPRCATPLIKVKNTGTSTVTSIAFDYGITGGTPATFTWTGQLAFLDTALIAFPPTSSILTRSVLSAFQVSVTAVNGIASDENNFNNTYDSKFDPVLVTPDTIVIKVLSNQAAAQNQWILYDEFDTPIVTSQPFSNGTLYKDTIAGLPPGCYRLTMTDYGCDGLQWWANASQGSGSMRLEKINGNSIYVFPTDFGCEFTKFFAVVPKPAPPVDTTPVTAYTLDQESVQVFPNPAGSMAYLKIDIGEKQDISYSVSDISGKVVFEKSVPNANGDYEKIDLSNYSNGVYFVKITLEDKSFVTRKLVVQK